MLDKSIKYKNIIMRLENLDKYSDDNIELPEGFKFKFYENGDEKDWAKIETSVLEFESETDAISYFSKEFFPYVDELLKRCVYIKNSEEELVATGTAWFLQDGENINSLVHWIAVKPQFQGIGLGKAITKKVLNIFYNIKPNEKVYLHTQTWSHKAIRVYYDLGFRIIEESASSVEVLREVMDKEFTDKLLSTAVK